MWSSSTGSEAASGGPAIPALPAGASPAALAGGPASLVPAVAPELPAGTDDLAFLSDAARSKVVELVRSISAQFAGSAAGIRREVTQHAAAGAKTSPSAADRNTAKGKERLRAIWTESLANDISTRTYNEASIRISRERQEVWICRPGPSDDPAPKTYRMQEQPKCFETHMKLWEASTRGFDLSIEYLRKSLAKLDQAAPDEASVPPPRRMFGRQARPGT